MSFISEEMSFQLCGRTVVDSITSVINLYRNITSVCLLRIMVCVLYIYLTLVPSDINSFDMSFFDTSRNIAI